MPDKTNSWIEETDSTMYRITERKEGTTIECDFDRIERLQEGTPIKRWHNNVERLYNKLRNLGDNCQIIPPAYI